MKVIEILGYAGASLHCVVALGATATYFSSRAKLGRTFDVTVRPVVIPTDKMAIAHGEHSSGPVAASTATVSISAAPR